MNTTSLFLARYSAKYGQLGPSISGQNTLSVTANEGAIINFIKQLRTGESIEFVFINGKEEEVAAFVDFDQETNLAMFVKNNGNVLIIDCSKIDAVAR